MKRKIIFVVTNDLTYDQRMIRICSALANNDFEVLLVGRKKNNSVPLLPANFSKIRLKLWFEKGRLFYLEFQIRLFFFLLFQKAAIIGSIDLDTLLPCFLVAKIKGKPCVFDAHEYFTEVPEVVDRPITKFIWETLSNWIIPRLKYAYTVSASLQEIFTKKYNVPFSLIRNIAVYSTPTSSHSPAKKQTIPILLYQGVLNEGRGLEIIITAMKKLPECKLWLAGEGDLSISLRKLVVDLELTKQVDFLGYLSPDDLKKITLQATIGLNLIENRGLSYYYSLANKTFDYMQAEVPAIHSNFPEYAKLMKKVKIGVVINDLEVETLVETVQALINNKELYKQLKDNCILGKGIFNWEGESKKLINIYKNIQ